jgi:hypothetical protein
MEIPTNINATYIDCKMLFIQNSPRINNFSDKYLFFSVPLPVRSNKISNSKSLGVE